MPDELSSSFEYSHYANGQHAATRLMLLALAASCGKEREFRACSLRMFESHIGALDGDPVQLSRRLALEHAREWLAMASPPGEVCSS